MCAGITTYNALRNSGARAGEIVAVWEWEDLDLGVEFSPKMGFKTVAIGRARDKEEELMKKSGCKAIY